MDIIKNKTKLHAKIVPLFVEYVDKLSKAHKHIYDLVADIKDNLDKINTHIKHLQTAMLDSPENVFKTMQSANNIDNYLHHVYEALHLNIKDIPSEMSNTFMLEVEKDFKNIVVKYAILVNDNKVNNVKLIHTALDKIKNSSIKDINTLFDQYQNTVNLYTHYIQHQLDTLNASSKEYVLALDSLEVAKTNILNNATVEGKKLIPNKDVVMQTFGLIPMWQHMDEKQVLRQALDLIRYENENGRPRNPGRMYGGYTPDKLKEMADIFREKKMGLFVLVAISSNPIAFDYRTLTHRKTVETLVIPDNSGLNDNVLKKFDNIKDVTSDFKGPVFKNIRLGKTDSDKWLVIRTLNGTHYDIMGINKDNMFVNKAFVDKLDRGPSLLIDTYQLICNNKLVPHLKPPQEVVLDLMITPLQNIANKVIREMQLYVDERLKEVPTNLKELFDIIGGTDIEDLTSRIIIQSYEDIDSSAGSPELSSTFLFNADYVIKGFVKSVKERFAKSDLNEFMFKEKTKNALIVHIRTRLSDIVKISAEKAFDPRKDIYEKLMVKKSLLNIEL
jgi:hypothetical protein